MIDALLKDLATQIPYIVIFAIIVFEFFRVILKLINVFLDYLKQHEGQEIARLEETINKHNLDTLKALAELVNMIDRMNEKTQPRHRR